MIDPGCVDSSGEVAVSGDDVDAHAEISFIVVAVVPPGESSLVWSPPRCVDIDESCVEDCSPRFTFRGGDVCEPDERVRMKDVAVCWGDVDVSGDDETAVNQPFADSVCQLSEEPELVLIVPMADLTAMRNVDGDDPNSRRRFDPTADQSRFSVEVIRVATIGGVFDGERVQGSHGDTVVRARTGVDEVISVRSKTLAASGGALDALVS